MWFSKLVNFKVLFTQSLLLLMAVKDRTCYLFYSVVKASKEEKELQNYLYNKNDYSFMKRTKA